MDSLSPVERKAGLMEVNGGFRIAGNSFTGMAAGGALELSYDGSNAIIKGYDGINAVYKQVIVDGFAIVLRVSGANRMIISNDGVDVPAITVNGVPVKTNAMATARILGRGSAGAGAIEELTLGAGLALSGGGVLSATGATGQQAFTTVEVDLGYPMTRGKAFTITGLSGLAIGKPVNMWLATGPYTGKGSLPGEEAMYPGFTVSASVTAADTITARLAAMCRFGGKLKFNYSIGA